MKLLIIHMGIMRHPKDALNIKGIRYANVDNLFEKVFVLMPPYPGNKERIFFMENYTQVFNFGYNKIFSYLNYFKLIAKAIYLKKRYGFDMIHAYNPHMCGLVGAILKKMFKLPLVISIHSNLETLFSDNLMAYLFKSKLLTETVERICLRNADQIWVQADYMKDYIHRKYSLGPDKFRKIKILIDEKEFPMINERRHSPAAKTRSIIFVGRLDPQKNVISLLEAYKIIKEKNKSALKLIIIGDGIQRKKLLDFKLRNGLSGISFLGELGNNKIHTYLLEADCFVHPGGLGEGFSNTILEAQRCGLPLVVSDIYPEKEFIDNSNVIHYKYNHPDDLARKIEFLLSNPQKMDYLSRMSIETARRYFQESPFNTLKKLYREVSEGCVVK